MPLTELHVVTGAFGFTGRSIARRLVAAGKRVRTLTADPNRANPFGVQVDVAPLLFTSRGELVKAMRGAAVLYNTYWIRFPYKGATYEKAVANTEILLRAAREAGVRKIVHISIVNASEDSPLPYFHAKGIVEKEIVRSGLPHAIVRPTVIFGLGDILINNIAWLIRNFPLFAVPGRGDYRVQPVSVDDVARLAVEAGGREESAILDAAGPDVFAFDDLVRLIGAKLGRRVLIVHVRPGVSLGLARFVGDMVQDVLLTRDEIRGLMEGLLVSGGPPTGMTRLADYLERHADKIGKRYASEVERHYAGRRY